MEADPLLTVWDIAEEWGVHVRTVRTWIRNWRNGKGYPQLPTVRTEGRFRVRVRRSVAESVLGERPTKTA